MFKWIGLAVATTVLAFACGGGKGGSGSGIDPNTRVADLTPTDLQKLCEYFVGLQEQPSRTIDCGGGGSITVGIDPDQVAAAIADCVDGAPSSPACPATVGQAEACFEAFSALTDAQLCAGPTAPAACAPLDDPACN